MPSAVIEAARAFIAYYWSDAPPDFPQGAALYAAVRALPRPLSERLAELRPGDVVEAGEKRWLVKANDPELMEMWLRSRHETVSGQPYNWTAEYNEIESIISPEADRG